MSISQPMPQNMIITTSCVSHYGLYLLLLTRWPFLKMRLARCEE
jgi:hypothetical protein